MDKFKLEIIMNDTELNNKYREIVNKLKTMKEYNTKSFEASESLKRNIKKQKNIYSEELINEYNKLEEESYKYDELFDSLWKEIFFYEIFTTTELMEYCNDDLTFEDLHIILVERFHNVK